MYNFSDLIANMFGWFIFIVNFTIVPTILVYIVLLPLNKVTSKKSVKYFGKMFNHLKVQKKSALFNNVAYIFRRILLINILLSHFFVKYLILQIIFLCYLQFAAAIYAFKYKPFVGRLSINTELVNEITILVATESLLMYTNIIDPDTQNKAAWISFSMLML